MGLAKDLPLLGLLFFFAALILCNEDPNVTKDSGQPLRAEFIVISRRSLDFLGLKWVYHDSHLDCMAPQPYMLEILADPMDELFGAQNESGMDPLTRAIVDMIVKRDGVPMLTPSDAEMLQFSGPVSSTDEHGACPVT
eukprot:m.232475 g.232475  ORF g.232475 m.232475 type:complete len:138 (+) comp19276_c0_seq3:370-783(+)